MLFLNKEKNEQETNVDNNSNSSLEENYQNQKNSTNNENKKIQNSQTKINHKIKNDNNINEIKNQTTNGNSKAKTSQLTKKAPFIRKLSIKRNTMRRGNQSEFEEKVIDISRVTTVVKGGRRFSFSAFVVVGNKKGKIGFGHGKANEVPNSIKKAIKISRKNLIEVPIIDKRTIPHEQIGKFLASKILIKPAPKGKGIIASGTIRSVVELAGYKDIYTKSLGSRSKANSVKAVLKALQQLRTIEKIAKLRDLKVSDILG